MKTKNTFVIVMAFIACLMALFMSLLFAIASIWSFRVGIFPVGLGFLSLLSFTLAQSVRALDILFSVDIINFQRNKKHLYYKSESDIIRE